MSIDDAAKVAYQAGFRDEALVTAVAIAGAESGYSETQVFDGNPGQTNPEHSVGYWQINLLAHPEYSEANMKKGLNNAQAAYTLSGGGSDFSAWSTYNDGKYLAHKSEAQSAIQRYIVSSSSGASGGVGATQDCVSQCLIAYPVERDSQDPTNASNRANCVNGCVSDASGGVSANPDVQQTAAQVIIPCTQCAWNNITPCFSCMAAYLTKGLVSIGINLGLALLVLIGFYLLFRPEIHETITKVTEHGKDVAREVASAAAAAA